MTRPPVPSVAPSRARALLAVLVTLAVGAAVVSDLYGCPAVALFHVPCPGCGTRRACVALANGDLRAALAANPIGPLVVVGLAGLVAGAVVRRARGDRAVLSSLERAWLLGLAAAVLAAIVVWAVRFAGGLGGPVPI